MWYERTCFMDKIISFDIWDTIIKRKCHPEEIKLHTAKYIVLKYEEQPSNHVYLLLLNAFLVGNQKFQHLHY